MRRLLGECCAKPDLVDSSRQPALEFSQARRLTCGSCGMVSLNIDGEYNPDIDEAICPKPHDSERSTD